MHNSADAKDQLAFAIDAAELGTWDLDPITGKFTVNERVKSWLGIDHWEEMDIHIAEITVSEKDRSRVKAEIERALSGENNGNYEVEYSIINLKTKQERVVRAKGKALFNDQKKPYRFNGIVQDITTEVLAREQLQKLLALVDNSVDLMSILELNGANSYINSAGRDILGIDQDADVSIIPISHFHTPEQIKFVETEIIPSVMTTGKWAGQFAIRNGKTGEIIPLFNHCHKILDSHTGEPIGVGAVMRDMRPELNARRELEEKVKERTKELQEANDELERKNKELESFAYVSSHDLQEPLRKINTFISRIEKEGLDSDPERVKDFFRRIKVSATRMQGLISDLLSFSSTNTYKKEFVNTDLNDLLKEVLADLNDPIQKSKAVISVDNLPSAKVIVFQFHQLFTNLVTNAIKFAKKDSQPHISISGSYVKGDGSKKLNNQLSKDHYHITVRDNGIGFEPQYANRIFEVFQRLHGREEYEGTGIGLAICKKIVENHQGMITAEGEPGKGAQFHIYIPV